MTFSCSSLDSIKLLPGKPVSQHDPMRIFRSARPHVVCPRFGVLFPAQVCTPEFVKLAVQQKRIKAL